MKLLWAGLAMLLVAAIWALRDPVATAPDACDAPPWELLDRARRDGSGIETAAIRTPDTGPRDVSVDVATDAPGAPASSAEPTSNTAGASVMPPGSGTERQPFRVSWELLGQASGHVRGDGTVDGMPRTLDLLSGAWIELSGFYAPAVIAASTDELVLMLNRWDGCCIGLPPTPYDSALVKTRAPIDFSLQHQIRFGTLRGRLVLEPFALGGIVLGLYRIEDAELLR